MVFVPSRAAGANAEVTGTDVTDVADGAAAAAPAAMVTTVDPGSNVVVCTVNPLFNRSCMSV